MAPSRQDDVFVLLSPHVRFGGNQRAVGKVNAHFEQSYTSASVPRVAVCPFDSGEFLGQPPL